MMIPHNDRRSKNANRQLFIDQTLNSHHPEGLGRLGFNRISKGYDSYGLHYTRLDTKSCACVQL